MKKKNTCGLICWVKNKTLSTPNRQIITIGFFVMVIFFMVANLTKGILSSLFVNLTAGVAIVILTVVLVDMLRTTHLKKQFEVPRETAITQIKNANFGLFNSMIIYCKDIEYIRKFYVAATQMTANDNSAISIVLFDYAKFVNGKPKLLESVPKEKIVSLGRSLEKTVSNLEKTRQRYDYSFADIDFKTDVVNLVDKADAALAVFPIADYDSDLLNQVIKPINPKDPRPKGDEGLQAFVGAVLSDYIKTYVEFGKKYFKP